MDYPEFFRNKRVTLMGLGILGRGVGDAAFLAPLCKELVVTDLKSAAELQDSLAQLQDYTNIRFVLGEHCEEDFTQTDLVIKAAGVPLESRFISAAEAAGVPVHMSTALFAQFARKRGAILVGVTGTRGKSTTAALIYHALAVAGKAVHIGGNVRGVSTLAMLPTVESGDLVVLELDSWQLQGFGALALSPDVAVFTNLMPDHMNYYHDNMEAYFADKANIFKFQKEGDTLISNPALAERIAPLAPAAVWVQPAIAVSEEQCPNLVGEHNRYNAALTMAALDALGLTEEEIRAGLLSFVPVDGRLQFVRTVGGIKVYNDNNATTPDATIAALRAFADKKVVLIVGGSDKGLDVSDCARQLAGCVSVVLLPGTGTDRLMSLLTTPYVAVNTMEEAVVRALSEAAHKSADVVLFSPGFASFGLFNNEYERNDQFVAALERVGK